MACTNNIFLRVLRNYIKIEKFGIAVMSKDTPPPVFKWSLENDRNYNLMAVP
jgi:hypothetical protein